MGRREFDTSDNQFDISDNQLTWTEIATALKHRIVNKLGSETCSFTFLL